MAVRTPLKLGTGNNPQQMTSSEIATIQAYCQYLYFEKWWRFNGGVQLVTGIEGNFRARDVSDGGIAGETLWNAQTDLDEVSSRFNQRAALTDSRRLAGETKHSTSSFGSPANNTVIETLTTSDFLYQVSDDVTSEPHATLMDTTSSFTYPLFYNSGNLQAMTREDMYDTFIKPAIDGTGSSVSSLASANIFYRITEGLSSPSGFNPCPVLDIIEGQDRIRTNLGNRSNSSSPYYQHVSSPTDNLMFPGADGVDGPAHALSGNYKYFHSYSANYPTVFTDRYTTNSGVNNIWDTSGSSAGHLYSITSGYSKKYRNWQRTSPRSAYLSGQNFTVHRRNNNPFSSSAGTAPLHTDSSGNMRVANATTWATILGNMMCWVSSNVASYRLDFNFNTAISGNQNGDAITDTARDSQLLEYKRDDDNYFAGYVPKGSRSTQNTYTLLSRVY